MGHRAPWGSMLAPLAKDVPDARPWKNARFMTDWVTGSVDPLGGVDS